MPVNRFKEVSEQKMNRTVFLVKVFVRSFKTLLFCPRETS